jgi:hypothetical protein
VLSQKFSWDLRPRLSENWCVVRQDWRVLISLVHLIRHSPRKIIAIYACYWNGFIWIISLLEGGDGYLQQLVRGAVLLGLLWEKILLCSETASRMSYEVELGIFREAVKGLKLMGLSPGCTIAGETWDLWWWWKRGWGTWRTRAAWVLNTVHSFGSRSPDLDPCYNLIVIVQFWYRVEPSRILKIEPININQCSKAEFSLSFLILPGANVPWRRSNLTFIWPWETVVH